MLCFDATQVVEFTPPEFASLLPPPVFRAKFLTANQQASLMRRLREATAETTPLDSSVELFVAAAQDCIASVTSLWTSSGEPATPATLADCMTWDSLARVVFAAVSATALSAEDKKKSQPLAP